MNNRPILIAIILVLLVAISILRILKERSDSKNNKINTLSNRDGKLYRYIYDSIINTDSDIYKGSEDHLYFYDTFRDTIHKNAKNILFENLESNSDFYSSKFDFLPDDYEDNGSIEKDFDKCFEKAIDNVLNDKDIENLLVNSFYKIILKNAESATIIENEAIEYHKQFGEEPDGEYAELHPKEPNTEEDIEDEIQERSIDYYASIGTVEDL